MDISTTPLARLDQVERTPHLRDLFAADPSRAERYVVTVGDLRIDYSKQRIDDRVLEALLDAASQGGVEARRNAMFAGEHINVTEDRAVMHVALRAPRDVEMIVDGHDVVPDVHDVLDRMGEFVERVRADDRITHVVKPRPSNGVACVGRLRARTDSVLVRVQCRWCRYRFGT